MTTISDRFKELPPSPTIEAMDEALSELWFRLELAGGQPGIQDRLLDVAELAYVPREMGGNAVANRAAEFILRGHGIIVEAREQAPAAAGDSLRCPHC